MTVDDGVVFQMNIPFIEEVDGDDIRHTTRVEDILRLAHWKK